MGYQQIRVNLGREAELLDLVDRMNGFDSSFSALARARQELGIRGEPITVTDFWEWITEGERYQSTGASFVMTPPIGRTKLADRVLFAGTYAEICDMSEILLASNQDKYQEVWGSFGDSGVAADFESKVRYLRGSDSYSFAYSINSFWERFFGSKNYLGEEGVHEVPWLIVTTGYMRNKPSYGLASGDGETINVSARLEKIAREWDIPIMYVPSWASKPPRCRSL